MFIKIPFKITLLKKKSHDILIAFYIAPQGDLNMNTLLHSLVRLDTLYVLTVEVKFTIAHRADKTTFVTGQPGNTLPFYEQINFKHYYDSNRPRPTNTYTPFYRAMNI